MKARMFATFLFDLSDIEFIEWLEVWFTWDHSACAENVSEFFFTLKLFCWRLHLKFKHINGIFIIYYIIKWWRIEKRAQNQETHPPMAELRYKCCWQRNEAIVVRMARQWHSGVKCIPASVAEQWHLTLGTFFHNYHWMEHTLLLVHGSHNRNTAPMHVF